ncbi:unnamed protein product (macronuclear) [Paramecium tetraurelia]|uniref:SAM-dependent MTase RsmB/NOP-type domain-containing protein n=1 Tax=Paramecium tetraurelia TaxID=5888 RepID=A0BV03_PARTE|nr:uncharacterized protein GSPATT00005616001 [Paramecium tetraurelia]CAK62370.1 unnamed protein product [Paramecium tetraurelia]|eukprot:XP_001429768.1 hypothetical protein (macronuclear) [Paramecium tetraurelia strain d4-2]
MNLRPFIKTHIKTIMTNFDVQRGPFDSFLREYYKNNKTLGPSERSIISQTAFDLVRNDLLLSHFTKDVDRKCDLLSHISNYENDQNIPLQDYILINYKGIFDVAVQRCKNTFYFRLFQLVSDQYGQKRAYEFFMALNTKAPLTIRINPIKTTREKLMQEMNHLYFKKTLTSPYGLIISKENNVNLSDTDQFKEGLFEIQDEASQICALRVQCRPNDKVLDYCAGSGGKTLAFAHQMEGKGVIEINDTRSEALSKAKIRLRRAGIMNYSFFTKKFKYDWILLDVPCTGLGTLRRNPDSKYRFSQGRLDDLIKLQQDIFDQAIRYLKQDGVIVYTTCSFLKDENQNQVKHFCKKYNLSVVDNDYFQSLPEKGGMDGFFSISLKKN